MIVNIILLILSLFVGSVDDVTLWLGRADGDVIVIISKK